MSKVTEWEDLPDDKKLDIHNTYNIIKALEEFSNKVTPALFEYIYPDRHEHMTELFYVRSSRDILAFFGKLDIIAKQSLLVAIFEAAPMGGSDGNPLYAHC